MKKRIIALFLILLLAFSLLTPAFASSQKLDCYHANVDLQIDINTFAMLTNINRTLNIDSRKSIIRVIILKSWDGNLSSESFSNDLKKLGISYAPNKAGMTLIFDATEGNYALLTDSHIESIFDETTVHQYLEKYFRKDFEAKNYDQAITKLINALINWYQQNIAYVTAIIYYRPWYLSPLFIVSTYIISLVLLHILYGFFAMAAECRYSFDKFYSKQNLPVPDFKLSHILSSSYYCKDDLSIWSYIKSFWIIEHPFLSLFEFPDVKLNIFDKIARAIKLILLVLVVILMLFILVIIEI